MLLNGQGPLYVGGTAVAAVHRGSTQLWPLAVPTGLTSTPGIGQIALAWNAVPFAVGYVIHISGVQFVYTTATSYTRTGLAGGTSYSAQVCAVYKTYGNDVTPHGVDGNSAYCSLVSSTTVVPFNAATGGSTSDVSNYNGTGQTWRVHTLSNGQTFTVTSGARVFRALVAAAGGASGTGNPNGWGGPGGGGGVYANDALTLSVTGYAVTVGVGGYSVADYYGAGPSGGNSSFGNITAGGGGGGGNGAWDGKKPAGPGAGGNAGANGGGTGGTGAWGTEGAGGPGASTAGGYAGASTITGSSVTYGGGSSDAAGPGRGGSAAVYSNPPICNGGTGGTVIVAYQIA